jgi:lysozyme family protein
MANFDSGFAHTMKIEGGYSNVGTDRGGETYKGISRKYFPNWEGWKILDQYKVKNDLELGKNTILQSYVKNFYKAEFWDKLKGDQNPSQVIAEELFDTGVNQGVGTAVKFLQEALNVLNRNNSLYPDMVVDGVIGNTTLKSLGVVLKTDPEILVYNIINILQGKYYLDIIKKDPSQEANARGWLTRVQVLKT